MEVICQHDVWLLNTPWGERPCVPTDEGSVDPVAGVGMEMERFISLLGIQAQPFNHHTT